MISSFIREQKRYTKNELKNIFAFDEAGIEGFIKTLKSYGVLRTVKNNKEQLNKTDLLDEDIELTDEFADNDVCFYVFTYVGVIMCRNRIVKVYPKYLLSQNEPVTEMHQILKVLSCYSKSDEQIINFYNGIGEQKCFNLLAVILFLLNDYYENGLYDNNQDVIEINGEGEILWSKTIDEGFAIIEDERPYYTELYSRRCIEDETDYFRRLHQCVLTQCSKELEETQLTQLFDLTTVELSEEKLDDFGDKDYVLDCIYRELNVQFNSRKQMLLKTMYAYIAQNKKMLLGDEGISMYGTNSFHMVWEKACSSVFDNKLKTKISLLELSNKIDKSFDKNAQLIDIIEKPIWKSDETCVEANETLEPDIISVGNDGNVDYFVISDAKYYTIQLEKNRSLRGNPGISDVTKQYLYQLAYMNFINKHHISLVRNCFLMPTEQNEVIEKGTVNLKMLSSLGLQNIQIRLLPASVIFEKYITRQKMDISYLKLKDEGDVKDNIYKYSLESLKNVSKVAEDKTSYNVKGV